MPPLPEGENELASVGGRPKEELEGPGEYVVLNKVVVSPDLVFGGKEDIIDKVQVGTRVKVVEVRVCAEDKRIRGRLRKPPGWISLVNTETGHRWAAKMVLCPARHALQRRIVVRPGPCSRCARTMPESALVLCCRQCRFNLCTRCLKSFAPLKGWSYQVTAGIRLGALGFQHAMAPSRRVTVESVEPGTWADRVGIQPHDELTAINGISVDKVTPEELDKVLANSRPLDFTFVYSGPDEHPPEPPPPGSPRELEVSEPRTSSLTLSVVVESVDLTLLSADTQLLANFKSVMRHSVAAEAKNGVLREHVELSLSADPVLTVRCVVSELTEAAALDVRQRLGDCTPLGETVSLALNRLPKIRDVAVSGPVFVAVKLEEEPSRDQEAVGTTASCTKWPHMVATRMFLRRFKKSSASLPASEKL